MDAACLLISCPCILFIRHRINEVSRQVSAAVGVHQNVCLDLGQKRPCCLTAVLMCRPIRDQETTSLEGSQKAKRSRSGRCYRRSGNQQTLLHRRAEQSIPNPALYLACCKMSVRMDPSVQLDIAGLISPLQRSSSDCHFTR